MKRKEKVGREHSSGVRVVLFCLIVTVLTGLGISGFWLYQERTIVDPARQAATAAAEQSAAFITELEAKRKEPVYITLPGAQRIQAPVENYEDPTNLWTLVNKERALPMDYVPPQLVIPGLSVRANSTDDEKHVRAVIADPLAQMFSDAAKAGHSLTIGSGYRSSATQESLFNSYVASAGYEEANKYSAHAGHSEHQTGLAVDISTTTQQCYLSACFINTADGQWLSENAHKYGFTLRYPDGKEAITGYNFEPWHYRYVGVDLATALYESQITLDQAWPYLLTALQTLRDNRAF